MSKAVSASRPRRKRPYEFNGDLAMQTRVRLGLSQRDLSDRSEALGHPRVDNSNLAKYERGTACPSPRQLTAIAAVLGLTVDDLVIFRTESAA